MYLYIHAAFKLTFAIKNPCGHTLKLTLTHKQLVSYIYARTHLYTLSHTCSHTLGWILPYLSDVYIHMFSFWCSVVKDKLDQINKKNGEKLSIEFQRNYEKTADKFCGKHVIALYVPISGEMSGWYVGTGFSFFTLWGLRVVVHLLMSCANN